MQFDTLDVSVQEEFEKYLQERGVNESLAIFIPEYAEHKEQQVCTLSTRLFSITVDLPIHQEYIKWLEVVKNFVEL